MRIFLSLLLLTILFHPLPLIAGENTGQIVFLSGHQETLAALADSRLSREEKITMLKQEGEAALAPLRQINGLNVRKTFWSIRAALVEGDVEAITRSGLSVLRVVPDRMEQPEKPFSSDVAPLATGESVAWGLKKIHVAEAWEQFNVRGRGVRIGIIDSGLDGAHPEFADHSRIAAWYDFTSDDLSSGIDNMTDSLGHGSHVAGTIAGGSLSGKAIGIAPECKLVIAKAIGRSGARVSALLEAMQWMIDPDGNPATDDGPRAVNCSWHSGYGDQEPYYAMIDAWLTVGIVPCFSAGNSGPNSSTITKPKEHPGTFASAAIDEGLNIASFSSRGPGVFRGLNTNRPDWAAPGVDVYSVRAGSGYCTKSGTSMASPHTCGVIALMLEARPDLDPAAIKDILKQTSLDRGDPGYDFTYGEGIIDAYQAVELALSNASLSGQVQGEGKPLSATILLNGHPRLTDAAGNYQFALPAGTHRLEFQAFGWESRSETITVTAGEAKVFNTSLRQAARITIRGKVTAKASAIPLSNARVKPVAFPQLAVLTDPGGQYSLNIPAGVYTIEITARGCETWKTGPREFSSSTTLNAELDPLPEVLLVAGDGKTKNYETWYERALKQAGISYRLHDPEIDGNLTDDVLIPFATVIWMTGDRSSNVFKSPDLELLTRYLNQGGRLFLSGQEIAYALRSQGRFLNDILAVRFVKDKATAFEVADGPFSDRFTLNGGDSAGNQRYPDVVAPEPGAVQFGSYVTVGEGAGVLCRKNNGVSVLLGFGLEGVPEAGRRLRIIRTVFKELKSTVEEMLQRLVILKQAEVSSEILDGWRERLARSLRNGDSSELPATTDSRLAEEEGLRGILLERLK